MAANLQAPTVAPMGNNVRDEFTFQVTNVDVSVVNALRRVILSDIPTVVIRTFPDSVQNPDIKTNTTRMHNEIIKQRLACVPVMTDKLQDAEKFDLITKVSFRINKQNTQDSVDYVTTGDIQLHSLDPTYQVPADLRLKLFPISQYQGKNLGQIDIVRLRAPVARFQRNQQDQAGSVMPGDQLVLEGRFAVGCARQFSGFNVASTVVFTNMQKPDLESAWKAYSDNPENNVTEQNKEFERKNWDCLQAKREVVANSFEFRLKPVGNVDPKVILKTALQILQGKLTNIKSKLSDMITGAQAETTIRNAVDINLVEEPNTTQLGDMAFDTETWEQLIQPAYEYVATDAYTIGKLLEYALYALYFPDQLNFCGFDLPHPHAKKAIVRLGFKETMFPKEDYMGFGGATQKGGIGHANMWVREDMSKVVRLVETAIDELVKVFIAIETQLA